MSIKETVIKLTCVLAMLCCFVQSAAADWYDDIKPNGAWVDIEGSDFVAETFYGVPALYNEDNRNYQCGELIIRFYKNAYGLDIRPYSKPVPTSYTEGYEFVKTKDPKPGDIIYVSAEMRDSDMDHWAIVREYSDGYITMFEQNARNNGQAAVGRKIKFPSDSYYIFTPVSTGNAPAPVLKNAVTGETAKPSATEKATQEATTKPTTTEPTTAKPTTTAAPTTTKPSTTKQVTTKPATTKPTTTQAATVTETASATATDVSLTVTEEVTTAVATTEKQSETQTNPSADEQKNKEESKYIVYAVAGAALAVGASAMLIIKKRK